jgi:hypothetical protein
LGVDGRVVGRDSGGIVLPRVGSAVDMRTGGGISGTSCEVECGARVRGSGATSPAPRIGGTGDVIRGAFTLVDLGDENKSALGSGTACCLLFCTRSISSFTAVDSVLAMRQLPLKAKREARRIANDPWCGKGHPLTKVSILNLDRFRSPTRSPA